MADGEADIFEVDGGADADVVLAEVAAVDFDGEGDHVALGLNAIEVEGDQGVDLADCAAGVGVGEIEWQGCVEHPERALSGGVEDKQHAVTGWQGRSLHQAALLLGGGGGQLKLQCGVSDPDGEIGGGRCSGLRRCGWLATAGDQQGCRGECESCPL